MDYAKVEELKWKLWEMRRKYTAKKEEWGAGVEVYFNNIVEFLASGKKYIWLMWKKKCV